ncbi:hypothetical protein TNCV_247991 [Trichonephila clavipes]|nr:hypothetical protein TNCV_247991 [Trichonephila clavipes]
MRGQFHSGSYRSLIYMCTNVGFVNSSMSVAPLIACIPGAFFQQANARSHVAKIVREFCSAQHMQLLPWPAYSPDMSPIVPLWDLVGPAASKDELLLRIQVIWNSLLQADIQNMFDSMPRHIAALIVAHGGYTKYRYRTLNIVFLL